MSTEPCPGGGDEGYEGGRASLLDRIRSFSDIISAFFVEFEGSAATADYSDEEDCERDVVEEDGGRKQFWESQMKQLQASLALTSSVERRIKRDVEKLSSPLRTSSWCSCRGTVVAKEYCSRCANTAVCEGLRATGYDCAVCNSKWKTRRDVLHGEHNFLDIIHTSAAKQTSVRIVVELNFRSEFEIARAGSEYRALVGLLPELFVGKPEKLRSVVTLVCAAAKRSIKDSGMHVGPWRRHKYMLSKWLGASVERRDVAAPAAATPETMQRRPKLRASLLTIDLLGIERGFPTAVVTAS